MVTIELITGADGAGTGNVTGPLGTSDNILVQFSGTTGRVIKANAQTGLVKVTSGVVSIAVAGTDYASGTHTHAAADIASGTVPTARLGGGTANSSSFLRGDQVWAAPTAISTVIVQENDTTVDGAASTFDFDGTDFNVTSSPAGEANIAFSGTLYRKVNITHPHVETSGTTPTGTRLPNSGTTSTIVITGNDTCGTFNLTPSGTGIAAGTQFTFGFATARNDISYAVFIANSSSSAWDLGSTRITGRTTTGFDFSVQNMPVASTSYIYFYWIVEY